MVVCHARRFDSVTTPGTLPRFAHTVALIAPLLLNKVVYSKKIRLILKLLRLEIHTVVQNKLVSTVQYHTTSSFTRTL